jgi:hypothetical protein
MSRFPSLVTFLEYSESKAIRFAAVCDTLSWWRPESCPASYREHGASIQVHGSPVHASHLVHFPDTLTYRPVGFVFHGFPLRTLVYSSNRGKDVSRLSAQTRRCVLRCGIYQPRHFGARSSPSSRCLGVPGSGSLFIKQALDLVVGDSHDNMALRILKLHRFFAFVENYMTLYRFRALFLTFHFRGHVLYFVELDLSNTPDCGRNERKTNGSTQSFPCGCSHSLPPGLYLGGRSCGNHRSTLSKCTQSVRLEQGGFVQPANRYET